MLQKTKMFERKKTLEIHTLSKATITSQEQYLTYRADIISKILCGIH